MPGSTARKVRAIRSVLGRAFAATGIFLAAAVLGFLFPLNFASLAEHWIWIPAFGAISVALFVVGVFQPRGWGRLALLTSGIGGAVGVSLCGLLYVLVVHFDFMIGPH